MAFEHIGPIVGRVMARIAAGRTEPVSVVLPEPPSANVYWRRHGHVMHLSREAKEYSDTISGVLAQYRRDGRACFPVGDLSVVVVWHRRIKRGDLDNRTKVLYDALEGILFADDAQIAQDWRRRVDAHPTIPKGCVQVEVCPIAPEEPHP